MFNRLTPKASKAELKRRLRQAGISYRDLSAMPGVNASFQYISDILNDRRDHYGHALCARLEKLLENPPEKKAKGTSK